MMINGRLPGSIELVCLPINAPIGDEAEALNTTLNKNTPVVEDKIIIVSLLYAWRIWLLSIVNNRSAAAKGGEAAANTEVVITAATVAIAEGKLTPVSSRPW